MTSSSWNFFRAWTSRFYACLLLLPAQIFERLHFERAHTQRRNPDFCALDVPRLRQEHFPVHFAAAQFRDQQSHGLFFSGGNEHLGFLGNCCRSPGGTRAIAHPRRNRGRSLRRSPLQRRDDRGKRGALDAQDWIRCAWLPRVAAETHGDKRAQKNGSSKRSRRKNPAALRSGLLVETGADARQEVRWNVRIRGGAKTVVDDAEKRLLFSEERATRSAGLEVRARGAFEFGAGGGPFGQCFSIVLTWHCNFSANCFRAKNNLDFTVPTGRLSRAATSSSVWPSITARRSTRRNFSGNS